MLVSFQWPRLERIVLMDNTHNNFNKLLLYSSGIRIYTEDVEDVTCPWWKLWCTPGEQITNVDFASQINVKLGYPHPKMATLILREREGNSDGYTYKPCLNSENKNVYNHQWWPQSNLDSDMMPNSNNHHLDKHYERRLMNIPQDVRGPSLEYVSVAKCAYESSYSDIRKCLNRYIPSMVILL